MKRVTGIGGLYFKSKRGKHSALGANRILGSTSTNGVPLLFEAMVQVMKVPLDQQYRIRFHKIAFTLARAIPML